MHQPIQLRDRRGRRKYLSPEERERFFVHAASLPEEREMFCKTLYYTGCRISEALNLRLDSIDLVESLIVLQTLKRRTPHQRTVPVPRSFARRLAQLDNRLFPFSRRTGFRIIKRVMDSAGIKGPHSNPRGLRHGFGIACATQDVVVSLIQRWMGHASIQTTLVYLDAVGKEEREFIRRIWGKP